MSTGVMSSSSSVSSLLSFSKPKEEKGSSKDGMDSDPACCVGGGCLGDSASPLAGTCGGRGGGCTPLSLLSLLSVSFTTVDSGVDSFVVVVVVVVAAAVTVATVAEATLVCKRRPSPSEC